MNKQPSRIAVIGGGSWGTALTKMLCDHKAAGGKITDLYWWVRTPETADYIIHNHHNPNYISSVEIRSDIVTVTHDLEFVLKHSELIILAVPSAFLMDTLKSITPEMLQSHWIVSAIKGLVPHTRQIIADYLTTAFNVPADRLMVISGPCHAEEVASEKLSYLTIAGMNSDAVAYFASLLSSRYIRTILSDDITGTEYGAVLKNIYAVASGICHGLGFGDNFQAVLVSNAIREMERFLYAVKAHPREINHSAYLGDLLVTAYSQHSRNRTFGMMMGKGYTVQTAQLEMKMIAEGYYATKSLYELNQSQLKVEIPIAEAVYNILYKNSSARKEIDKLCDVLV
ncbi:MAG: NAD(P)H-dependent glycerol-3-phosphate dehydrogenase [Bacteroidia bacterium]|jgi:glycerol-3-phosphate dehydrogenase (NAD(P)+)